MQHVIGSFDPQLFNSYRFEIGSHVDTLAHELAIVQLRKVDPDHYEDWLTVCDRALAAEIEIATTSDRGARTMAQLILRARDLAAMGCGPDLEALLSTASAWDVFVYGVATK